MTPSGAHVLRVSPGGESALPQCLQRGEIVIGWPDAQGLVDSALSWTQFRGVVADTYYADEPTLRRAGGAAGHLWRFIRTMQPGDLVVVPEQGQFYVGQVTGEPFEQDGYRRTVTWLNEARPIERRLARAALQSRMKVQGTTADATDLVADIVDALNVAQGVASGAAAPTFESDLRRALVQQTLTEMRQGRVENYGFERLVRAVITAMGASSCTINDRRKEKGDDLTATFHLAGQFEIKVAIQVKHYFDVSRPLLASVVDEVANGMDNAGADFGIVMTAGTLSQEAAARAEQLAQPGARADGREYRIALVDGEQLAAMYVAWCVGERARR